MTNLKLDKLIGNTFYWDVHGLIKQRTISKTYYRSWRGIHKPNWLQIQTPIAWATRNTVKKEND